MLITTQELSLYLHAAEMPVIHGQRITKSNFGSDEKCMFSLR